jgi:hypothetical protein
VLPLDEGAKLRLLAVFGEQWWEREANEETLAALSDSVSTRAKVKLSTVLLNLWGGSPSSVERRALIDLAKLADR